LLASPYVKDIKDNIERAKCRLYAKKAHGKRGRSWIYDSGVPKYGRALLVLQSRFMTG